MATHQSNAGKHTKPAEIKKEIPAAAQPAQADVPPVVETVASTAAVEIAAPAAEPKQAHAASVKFDSADWAKKSIEIWSEHAAAVLDLAERIARAKTLDEVVTLQSRFASERLDSFLRQSRDAAAFARSVFAFAATPYFGARSP